MISLFTGQINALPARNNFRVIKIINIILTTRSNTIAKIASRKNQRGTYSSLI